MTWKRKTLGLVMSLAVLAALALSSGADAWYAFIFKLDAWY
jgi:hypothetical protein